MSKIFNANNYFHILNISKNIFKALKIYLSVKNKRFMFSTEIIKFKLNIERILKLKPLLNTKIGSERTQRDVLTFDTVQNDILNQIEKSSQLFAFLVG